MKKLAYCLACCLIVFLGGFAFSGCASSSEIKSIKIKDLPTTTTYTVGQTLNLAGGTFTVEFANGTKRDLTMSSNIEASYIDYANDEKTNRFVKPNPNQIIVVTYKGKSDTFNVSVDKAPIEVNYSTTYEKVYNGLPQPLSEITNSYLNLDKGANLEKIEYSPLNKAEFTTEAPTNAGEYNVKLTINGGNDYSTMIIADIVYTIKKASLEGLTENKTLFLPNLTTYYTNDLDLSASWKISQNANGTIVDALGVHSDFAQNLVYSYRLQGTEDYTDFVPDAQNRISTSALKAGTYDIKVSGSWENNVLDFEKTAVLTVMPKTLQYGVDYTMKIIVNDDAENAIDYVPVESVQDIPNRIVVADASNINVKIVVTFSDKVASQLNGTAQVTYCVGGSWETNKSEINTLDTYKIVVNVDFNENTYVMDNTFKAVVIATE